MSRGVKEYAWRRFWRFVDRSAEGGGCWTWTGSITNKGYGEFNVGDGNMFAHRVAYELTFGEIPEGLKVLHTCDNPPCVRPAHLFLGTQLDNMRDMAAKGRAGAMPHTHCKRGHPLTADNVNITKKGRRCRECANASRRIPGGRGAYRKRAA